MKAELFTVDVMIPGICGNLEGRLLYSREEEAEAGMIICPPHPLLAGNMDNNVVQAVAQRMAASMPVLLFNYPAVGKSYKPRPELPLFEYWNGLDQGSDYGMIIEEVRQVIAWSAGYFRRLHLVGYSFGAHMALSALVPQAQALSYTAIAPPLAEYDFTSMQSMTLPACLIMAEADGLLAASATAPMSNGISRTTIKGADHFFLKREAEVADLVAEFILVPR
jgi:alpha/beta superfamily hydrolase